jgi:cytochrome P450
MRVGSHSREREENLTFVKERFMGDSSSLRLPPGPRGVPIFGNTLEAWRDPIGLMTRAVAEHGDVAQLRLGPYRYMVLAHPEAIRQVLVDNPNNYTKSRNYDGLRLGLGQGLLTSEGSLWRRQRKLAQPAFHRERLAGLAEVMVRRTRSTLARWESMGDVDLDLHQEMMRLTLCVVGEALFGSELDSEVLATVDAVGVLNRFAHEYVESFVAFLPTWLPTPSNVRFWRALRTLDRVVQRIIDTRRRSGKLGNDLLGMLLGGRDEETGEPIGDRLVRDEVMTFIVAGHETTASALTWTWHLLSQHPGAMHRVRDEVDAVLGDDAPTLSTLPRMETVARVVQESMRLYPPAWSFERQAIEDDRVMGFDIPSGSIMGISPYLLHRNPLWWERPEEFDPDRFLPDRIAKRPRYAYLPFGGGPRTCIGSAFAMMESQIAVAMVARRFAPKPCPARRVDFELDITLRPKGGLRMRMEPRFESCERGITRQRGAVGGARSSAPIGR